MNDDDGKKIAAAYEKFPPHLVFIRPGYRPDGWILFCWKDKQDNGVKEAIWLLEHAQGAYENRMESFDEDLAIGEYDPLGCHVVPDELITIEGEMTGESYERGENK